MWVLLIMYILLIPSTALFIHTKHTAGGDAPQTVGIKGACTTLIALTAILGVAASSVNGELYAVLIAAGLVLGLVGDLVICQKGTGGFLSGMIYFALGHLCYVGAFFHISAHRSWSIAIFIVVYLLLLVIARRLKLRLGKMTIPVAVYCGIITAMLSLAATVPFSVSNGFVVLAGAVLFAVSDGILAYRTFGQFQNIKLDSFGLYCYFIGQSLFAASIYVFALFVA